MSKNQMVTSDFNLIKIRTSELNHHLQTTIELGGAIFIAGRRGSGKTECSKQQIRKAKMAEVYLNMSVQERPDLGGYPNIMNHSGSYVNFLLPSFYEPMMEGDKKVVLLLDEVDKVDSALQAPLLEITQFKSINGRHLKNLHSVVMTGNLIAEGGSRPSLPLLDRAEKYMLEPDSSSWLEWASSSDGGHIHPTIVNFITDNPQQLFGNTDPEDMYADPSPRGWANASKILRQGERLGFSPNILTQKVCGCVGKNAGKLYEIYYTHYVEIFPLIKAILDGVDFNHIQETYRNLENTRKIVAVYTLCNRIANILDAEESEKTNKSDVDRMMKNSAQFMKIVSHELAMSVIRGSITIDRMIRSPRFEDGQPWKEVTDQINLSVNQ